MSKILTREEWCRRKRIKRITTLTIIITLFFVIAASSVYLAILIYHKEFKGNDKEAITQTLSNGEVTRADYLTPNPYSRPQTTLNIVKGIVVHYTANPGTSAENNRSYFEGLAIKHTTKASSHYIIGLEGEIIQCLPLTEQSYASNDRNDDTISIECCHPDETGEFNEATYASLVSLTAALCIEFNLEEEDIIRHYDVTEKLCPLYYVEHEDAWLAFKAEVMADVEKQKAEAVSNPS